MREQAHVLIVELQLVILVVGAFVHRLGPRLVRRDGCAHRAQGINLHAHPPRLRARDPADLEPGDALHRRAVLGRRLAARGHPVKHVVLAVSSGRNAAEEFRVGGKDRLGGFPDGVAVFVESEFVQDKIAGETARRARVGRQHLDAAGAFTAADGHLQPDFHPHVVVGEIG